MNAQTMALLQEIVRRESLSLLTYIGEAFPWTTSRGAGALLARLKQIVTDHNEAVAAIGRYLTKIRHPLRYLGSYPSSFTAINFLTLDHILSKLIAPEHQLTDALERDLNTVTDQDAHSRLAELLVLKKQQLQDLELLAAEHTKAAS